MFALVGWLLASGLHAQDFYVIQKGQSLLQVGPTTLVPNGQKAFEFSVRTPIATTLTIPGGATVLLQPDLEEGGYYYARFFSTKAALEAAFPDGAYTLSGAGIPTLSIYLVGAHYPAIPRVTNPNWNAGGALLLNPTQANTVTFTPFTTFASAGAAGFLSAELRAYNGTPGSGLAVSRVAVSRPIPGLEGEPQPFTSLTVGSGAMLNNTSYYGLLEHLTLASLDTTTVPGSVVIGLYFTDVLYFVTTGTSGTGGNPPVIVTQPTSRTAALGATTTFSVSATVAGSTSLLGVGVQWFHDGEEVNPVSGKISFSANRLQLTIRNLTGADAGAYAVRLFNTGGVVDSVPAVLTVPETIPPTTVDTAPAGGTFRVGQSATLSVKASGAAPLQYTWFKDGRLIPGETTANLVLTNLTVASAGGYHVVVSARGGTVVSPSATVVVRAPPQISRPPLDAVVETGLNVSFSASATGLPEPTLQWFSRASASGPWLPLTAGVVTAGVTEPILSLNAVTLSDDNRQFRLTATNSEGTVDSAAATLRVSTPEPSLRIRVQPQSQVVRAGLPVSLSVAMDGSGPFTFQWRKNGATLAGATANRIDLAQTAAADAGAYSVIVRAGNGGSTTSNTAFLTVAGAVDPGFDPRGGPDGEVTQLITLQDGSFLAAGSFTRVAGVARAGLARLFRDGTVDTRFDAGSGPAGAVRALVELANGKVLVVGQFDRFNGVAVPGVVRIQSTGQIDATFIPDLPVPPLVGGQAVPLLERFHSVALSLNGGGYLLGGKSGVVALTTAGVQMPQSLYFSDGSVLAMVQQYDGGVILGGDFSLLNGVARARMARLHADLRPDLTFTVGTGPNAAVQSLLRAPDGAIFVLGGFSAFNGVARPAGIARITPRGALDLSYNPALPPVTSAADTSTLAETSQVPAAGRLEAILAGRVQDNGTLVVNSGAANNQSVRVVEPSGSLSPDVNVPVAGAATAITLTDEGEVGVAGSFSSIGGVPRSNVAVVTDAGDGSRLVNLSCRSRISGETARLILGFVIQGPEAMRVLVRGVGPTLASFGISAALSRPKLTIYDGTGKVIAENTGWGVGVDPSALALIMQQAGAFAFESPEDTALVLNLLPGSYTAHLTGRSGAEGVALGEIYAVDRGRSRLVNSAVRGLAGTGENSLIPGFTVTGGSRLMLVRAIGPTLGLFGLTGTLQQPILELRRATGGLILSNQGWANSLDPAALEARRLRVGAFELPTQSADSAAVVSLEQGGYTVTVSGANGGTGDALVEVYDADGVDLPPLSP